TDANLPANLACWKRRVVNVRVPFPLADGPQSLGELARRDSLGRRTRHVGGRDGPLDCSRRSRRAGRLSAPTAQENHDSTGHVLLSEVNMRHDGVGGKIVETESEVD